MGIKLTINVFSPIDFIIIIYYVVFTSSKPRVSIFKVTFPLIA